MPKSKPRHSYKIKKPLLPITFLDDEYSDPPPPSKKPSSKFPLRCPKCNKTYANNLYYTTHMKLHTDKRRCKYCKKQILFANLTLHETACIARDDLTSKITEYFSTLK